jgi:hypothetical protein
MLHHGFCRIVAVLNEDRHSVPLGNDPDRIIAVLRHQLDGLKTVFSRLFHDAKSARSDFPDSEECFVAGAVTPFPETMPPL